MYRMLPLLFLLSCSLPPTSVEVVLPSIPSQWQDFSDEMTFLVRWWDGTNIIERHTTHNLNVAFPAIMHAPVVVIPQWRGVKFSPAAGFIPYDVFDGHLITQWKWGTVGEIFLVLLRERHPVMNFHLLRLREAVAELNNPARMKMIASSIISRQMRISNVKELPLVPYDLSLPGTWISTDPFLHPVRVSIESAEISLKMGLNYWIRQDKTAVLRVLVDDRKGINIYHFFTSSQ